MLAKIVHAGHRTTKWSFIGIMLWLLILTVWQGSHTTGAVKDRLLVQDQVQQQGNNNTDTTTLPLGQNNIGNTSSNISNGTESRAVGVVIPAADSKGDKTTTEITKPTPRNSDQDPVGNTATTHDDDSSNISFDAGLFKIAMNNEESWSAIYKIMVLGLGMFFGIKTINFVFRWLNAVLKLNLSL